MSGKQVVFCTECGEAGRVEKDRISKEKIIVCPDCELFLGVVPRDKHGRKKPKTKDITVWRVRAHAAFDPKWKSRVKKYRTGKGQERDRAYKWLSNALGIKREDCHIANFNIKMCQKVVSLCGK